jgi:poly-gamma-glutamate capsule biosynthesis protein CapA/YwtB (metallophosphatase superfamily)
MLAGAPTTGASKNQMQFAQTITAVGDIYLAKPLRTETDACFQEAARLFRAANVRFGNVETLLHDYDSPPAAQVPGSWAAAPVELAREIEWLGVSLAALAHNHSGDYGAGGMQSTRDALDALNIVCAGTGINLASARAPHYVDAQGGRCAIISATSSFMPHAQAGHQRSDAMGRPGVNRLRFETVYEIDQPAFAELSRIAAALPLRSSSGHREMPMRPARPAGEIDLLGLRFTPSDKFSVRSWCDPADLAEICASVTEARGHADRVIVSIHSHEYDTIREEPAAFLAEFCRAAVDAGADMVVGHGPHILRGIEIYRGRPILYSLGAFIFQPYLFPQQPADFFEALGLDSHADLTGAYERRRKSGGFFADREFWDSAIAHCAFSPAGSQLVLHPVDLWSDDPSAIGIPRLVDGERGLTILARVAARSRPFACELAIDEATCTASISF